MVRLTSQSSNIYLLNVSLFYKHLINFTNPFFSVAGYSDSNEVEFCWGSDGLSWDNYGLNSSLIQRGLYFTKFNRNFCLSSNKSTCSLAR